MAQFLRFALIAGASVHAAGTAQTAASQVVTFPSSPASGAVSVPADFVGFGYDGGFLNDYDNEFTDNLIKSVAARMSVPPIIRVGGTSSDRLTFNPGQTQNTTCVSGPCPYGAGTKFIIGPSYFKGFAAHPFAKVTFQAPMQKTVNTTNALDFVKRAYPVLGANRTAAIALGNEVNFYEKTASDYISAATALETAIVSALGLKGSGADIFELGDLASSEAASASGWTFQSALQQGLNKNGQGIIAAEHWQVYQVNGGNANDLQGQLMNHSAITQKFITYGKTLNYVQQNTNLTFALTETGSSLGGPLNFSNVFGSALWGVDFQLYGMSKGVGRIASTQRPTATHSLWVPISGLPDMPGPSVRAPFYSQPFVADFIGTKGQPQVVQWAMNGDSDFYTAYAAYENGQLARIAILNLKEWSGSGQRANTTFTVTVPGGKTSITAARLRAAAGAFAVGTDLDSSQPITYAGQQWTYKQGNGLPTPSSPSLETIQVSGGKAQINLPETEAILLHFS